MAELKLQHIYKAYHKDKAVIKDFNLHVKDKEFIVLVGPSGCGKSTILRLIAGLEELTSGTIEMDGKRLNDIPPKNRDIAFVFQNYALYPHMNIYNNMAFGLKSRKFQKEEIDRRVRRAAQIIGLEDYLDRKPSALSGGQRQRVALGRAIVRDAKLFLMDEPLSNLDAKLRTHMRTEIKKLHEQIKTTTIYVTHDQTEAMTMASRLIVMNNGEIQQIGAPKEVYEKPENIFVGGFIGSPSMNFLSGTVVDGNIHLGDTIIRIDEKTRIMLQEKNFTNKNIIIGIRPEDVYIASDEIDSSTHCFIKVKIETIELLGAENIVHTKIANQPFSARLGASIHVQQGQTVTFTINQKKLHFFDPETTMRIRL